MNNHASFLLLTARLNICIYNLQSWKQRISSSWNKGLSFILSTCPELSLGIFNTSLKMVGISSVFISVEHHSKMLSMFTFLVFVKTITAASCWYSCKKKCQYQWPHVLDLSVHLVHLMTWMDRRGHIETFSLKHFFLERFFMVKNCGLVGWNIQLAMWWGDTYDYSISPKVQFPFVFFL